MGCIRTKMARLFIKSLIGVIFPTYGVVMLINSEDLNVLFHLALYYFGPDKTHEIAISSLPRRDVPIIRYEKPCN
jgi:hypothetical protein